jgi:hypothetical protein
LARGGASGGQEGRRAEKGLWPEEGEESDERAPLVSERKVRRVPIRLGAPGGPWAVPLAGTNGRPTAFFFLFLFSCLFQTFS